MEGFEPITTQEQLNEIIKTRIERAEKSTAAKYEGYLSPEQVEEKLSGMITEEAAAEKYKDHLTPEEVEEKYKDYVPKDEITQQYEGYLSPDEVSEKYSGYLSPEDAGSLKKELEEYKLNDLRVKAARECGLPDSVAKRLKGNDFAELIEDAESFVKEFGTGLGMEKHGAPATYTNEAGLTGDKESRFSEMANRLFGDNY